MKTEKTKTVVPALIERLRTEPDGFDVSTAQLMSLCGYDLNDFQMTDMFDIHFSLSDAAKKAGMVLDLSAHGGREEGLPFDLDFVLRR